MEEEEKEEDEEEDAIGLEGINKGEKEFSEGLKDLEGEE